DESCLDRIAEAFARVVDAKSPWTYQHSTRVAEIAVGVARQFDCSAELARDLRRAALLHDIGKLGVSNLILDKPGKPTPDEFAVIHAIRSKFSNRLRHFARWRKFAAGIMNDSTVKGITEDCPATRSRGLPEY